MKKILMSISAAALLAATGCSNEEVVNQVEAQNYTLEVSVGSESRTLFDNNGDCIWGQNEKIFVTSADGQVTGTLSLVSLSSDGRTATFSGAVNGDPSKLKYTVYPVPAANGKIQMGNLNGENHNAPMYGTINGGSVGFNYAGGLVKLELNGAEGQSVTVNAKNSSDSSITGGFYTLNLATGQLIPGKSGGDVTISVPASGVIYLPVQSTATSTGTESVTVTVAIGEKTVTLNNIPVAQGAVSTNQVPEINYDETTGLTEIAEVATADSLISAINTYGKSVKLTGDITLNSLFTVVETYSGQIDLGGHTLSTTVTTANYPVIKNTGTLTVVNGKIEAKVVGIQNNGTLVVNCNISSVENAINNVYSGNCTIEGGSYTNTSNNSALIVSNNYGNGTPVLTINEGTFNSVFTNVSYNNASTGSVNGGTFVCTGNWHNIYVGGAAGGCNVNINIEKCSLTSNGVEIFVGDMSGTGGKTNTVNGQTYTGSNEIVNK